MYSPVTQNERHLNIIKKINIQNNSYFSFINNKNYTTRYKDIVVLSNPETILEYEKTNSEIKKKVIRADQLNKYMYETYNQSNLKELKDTELKNWANTFLVLHKEQKNYYLNKYDPYKLKIDKNYETNTIQKEYYKKDNTQKKEPSTVLYNALKAYRLKKSKEEKLKAYMVFSNKQLEDLIDKRPDTIKELSQISGFGEVKIKKYGLDIIKILEKYI